MLDLNALVSAVIAHNWPLFVVLIVGALVAFGKQRIAWIDAKLPAAFAPYVAVAFTLVATVCADVVAGQSLSQAIADAIKALVGATLLQAHRGLGIPVSASVAGRLKTLVNVPPVVGSMLGVLALGALLLVAGCTPMAPVVVQTADNAAQIASCQNLSSAHNGIVVGDFSLGVADTAVAASAAGIASSNPVAAKELGIGASVGAGVVSAGLVLANYYANGYAAQNCAQVLGPLPVLPAAKRKQPDPPVEITIVKPAGQS